MGNQVIPDEAVEAAARVLCGVTADMWKDQPTRIKDKYRWEAIAALEAAAPHLMAAAWDEGLEVGLVSAVRIDSAPDANPYRKDPDA